MIKNESKIIERCIKGAINHVDAISVLDTGSNDNTIEVYNCVSLIVFKPNLGPLIKLKVNLENANNNKTESVLKLERINGLSFYVQYWFSLIFTSITFIIGLYYLTTTGIDNIQSFLLPTISFIYFSIIKLIAKSLTKSLIKTSCVKSCASSFEEANP